MRDGCRGPPRGLGNDIRHGLTAAINHPRDCPAVQAIVLHHVSPAITNPTDNKTQRRARLFPPGLGFTKAESPGALRRGSRTVSRGVHGVGDWHLFPVGGLEIVTVFESLSATRTT